MGKSFSNAEMLNVILLLCSGTTGVPTNLYDLGFRRDSIWIEQKIKVGNGEVPPDMIMYSSDHGGIMICCESKSGSSFKAIQAQNYSNLQVSDVSRALNASYLLKSSSVDVLYVCSLDHAGAMVSGMIKAHAQHSVLCVDVTSNILNSTHAVMYPQLNVYKHGSKSQCLIGLADDRIKNRRLKMALAKCIVLDWGLISPHYYFDANSTEAEIAKYLVPQIIIFADRKNLTFTTEEITALSYGALWKNTGLRAEIYGRVFDVLMSAVQNELKPYIFRKFSPSRTSADTLWSFRRDYRVKDIKPQTYQALNYVCSQMISRIEAAPYYNSAMDDEPDQLTP